MAAAENTTGVWDGVQPQCIGTSIDAQYHSFYWQAHYTMAIPKAKRDAIAAAAAPGRHGRHLCRAQRGREIRPERVSRGRIPARNHRQPLQQAHAAVDPIDIRLVDPTYEDDFWSKPGYAGANPPNYLKAAKVDGFATITGITRNAAGVPTAIQFDPATVPALGTTGDNYLEYYVYGADGKTRLIDPARSLGAPPENKRRFSLIGNLDKATGKLTLTGTNSQVLLDALKVGSKIRVNNRFILAMYFYPRHSNIAGIRSHDQYRNADGSPKYPQRKDLSALVHSNYRTMGGRIETGEIKTKMMIMEGMADQPVLADFQRRLRREGPEGLGAGQGQRHDALLPPR